MSAAFSSAFGPSLHSMTLRSTGDGGDGISSIVDEVLASYQEDGYTRHIDSGPLAKRSVVIEVVHLLRELLFPGYFGQQDLSMATLRYQVGNLVLDLREKLIEQIDRALRHQSLQEKGAGIPREKSEKLVKDFLHSVPRLRWLLSRDVQAAYEGDPSVGGRDEIIFSYPGFFAVTVYRIAHELHSKGVPLIPRIMSEYAHSVTGIDIHAGASIDEYFFIDHGTGVVIGETAVIGKRVKIYQGVTLGALSTRGEQRLRGIKRHPTLEDEVTVYAGASILGGETVIGRNAVIGGNAFVTQSVPPYTRVSVRNPELQYRGQQPVEFKQELPADWII